MSGPGPYKGLRTADPPQFQGANMHQRFRSLALFAIAMATATPSAWAWGLNGHEIAGKLAESRLTPEAKAAVKRLLEEGETLAEASTWADRVGRDAVPESSPWHYVNVPITEPRYDAKFCEAQKGCVVSKIKDFRKVLADRDAPVQDRRQALRFLAHFVEDIHMPLHVGHNDDKGGNTTQVRFLDQPKGTNLHRIWDSAILDHAGLSDDAWVAKLREIITPEAVEEWSRGGVEDWANESLAYAKLAYQKPKGSEKPLRSGTKLDQRYVDDAMPIVRKRLAQSGVRLANELNSIFK